MDILSNLNFQKLELLGHTFTSYQTALVYFPLLIGISSLLSQSLKFMGFVWRQFLRPRQDLLRKYGGNDSWAVVTGGSDGIGEEYCKVLAQQGFNICIIARNEQKMIEKLKVIQQQAGRPIKTKYVIADFAKLTDPEDYTKVAQQLVGLDIGVLILNAGIIDFYDFKEAKASTIRDMININIIHRVYLAKALIKQLYDRPQRSAIIFMNSRLCVYPFASLATFSSTQIFLTYFAQALGVEVKDKIDVLSYECGKVGGTQLGAFIKDITPDTVFNLNTLVKSAFRDVGKEKVTNGCLRHEFFLKGFGLSYGISQWVIRNQVAKEYKEFMDSRNQSNIKKDQ